MKGTCTGCDNVTFIQNKKYGLCGECVYKKNHKGKSRQEVQIEKKRIKFEGKNLLYPSKYTIKPSGFTVDDEAQKNIDNQNLAVEKAKQDLHNAMNPKWVDGEPKDGLIPNNIESLPDFIIIDDDFPRNQSKEKINNYYEQTIKKRIGIKKSKPKQISTKQAEINKLYKLTCIDMDYTTEPVCTGCLKYQGGDIKLSHSHIISREDCKRIGRIDLVYTRENLTYHCLDMGEHTGCHRKHESPVERKTLADYQKNIEYIKSISEELYLKYTKNG